MNRSSGVLMAMSSLPSNYGIGTMGKCAYKFVDFLKAAGQKYWQFLPLGTTSYGDSPYQSFSSFAGNPYYIDLDLLIKDGLLKRSELEGIDWGSDPEHVDYGRIFENRYRVLRLAYERGAEKLSAELESFRRENGWLENYALYMSLKSHFGMLSWTEWPEEDIRLHKPEAVAKYSELLRDEIAFHVFIQYLFFKQWDALRSYAREVAAYTRGRGRLSCTLRGYEPCADAESVIAAIGYDPERDAENPTGSVFCEHGAGVYVPWNEVKARAHIPCVLQEHPAEAAEPMPTRSRASSGSAAEDKELLAIFESTYGKVERRAFEPKRAPARTALDETRYNIKNQKTGPEYLLVDGYNIIFAWDALKKLAAQDVAAAREALAGILANYRGWRRCEIILVFDAYKVKGNPGSMEKKNGIYIVYTKEAQTADSYIERATYDLGKNHRVRVATSDNMEQVIILGHGALRISARAFEEEVAEAEGQISDLIERWNVRDFDLRRVRATATIIGKKEEKGS
ncbi:MAG: hypothetical protein EGQ67_02735 [Clostridiales bacterium]|nr:hypothetical protein [Clostridiales bacterium]